MSKQSTKCRAYAMQMECYCKQKCLSRSALSKSNPNFRDIPRNVEENEMLLEIFRVVHTYVCTYCRYLVFSATFRVISREIDCLWDSVWRIRDILILIQIPLCFRINFNFIGCPPGCMVAASRVRIPLSRRTESGPSL